VSALVWSGLGVELYQGDAVAVMATIPMGSIDVTITDPPYSAHVHASGKRGSRDSVSADRDLGFASLGTRLRLNCAREIA
jgi:DNA modification methylase